jgi:hypothetical protein
MHSSFIERILFNRKGAIPHSFLSQGIDIATLSIFASRWRQTICDALVSPGTTYTELNLSILKRWLTIVERDLLDYHPGKQYNFLYHWQEMNDVVYTTKYVQHIHLLLAWGGEGLMVVVAQPYKRALSSASSIFGNKSGQEVSTITKRLEQSGFKVLGMYPAECAYPYAQSPWLDLFTWRVCSLFHYRSYLSPFITRVGIHFKKV